MRAVVIDETQAGRPLLFREVPDPLPGPADLLVAVRAAALNRADLRRAASHFKASEGRGAAAIAGLEFAGEVIGIGAEVSGYTLGDRIMAMAGGAYAEKATVDYRLAIPVPAALDWRHAAAAPIAFITAFDALKSAAQFKPGESVLVQGASTGVGIAAVQVARMLGAKTVFGTAGTEDKLRRIAELGCDVPIDYRHENVASVIQDRTGGAGVEVVLDLVGSTSAQGNLDSAALRGRIVCVGRVAGVDATLNLDEFARKRIHMIGVTFRTRTLDERIEVMRGFVREVVPALDRGVLRPVVDSVYPLAEAAAAQEHMRANRHFGKIILEV